MGVFRIFGGKRRSDDTSRKKLGCEYRQPNSLREDLGIVSNSLRENLDATSDSPREQSDTNPVALREQSGLNYGLQQMQSEQIRSLDAQSVSGININNPNINSPRKRNIRASSILAVFGARKSLKQRRKATAIRWGGAFAVLSLVFITASTFAASNGLKAEANADFTYYITTYYDGVDKAGVYSGSGDASVMTLTSDLIHVEDQLPYGLGTPTKVYTNNGTVSARQIADDTKSCSGEVVGGLSGIQYNSSTRTVSYDVNHLGAGCKITVGLTTKAPSSITGSTGRMDFFNAATASEGGVSSYSDTIHVFMGDATATAYTVHYNYAGEVPSVIDGSLPEDQKYGAGQTVSVSSTPRVDGYEFSGWTSSQVSINNKTFTMPSSNVTITGTWTKKAAAAQYTVSYRIDGEKPEGYETLMDRSYTANTTVKLDTLKAGDKKGEYVFDGWTTTSSIDLTQATFQMPASNVTIVGRFSKPKKTLSYQFSGDVPSGVTAPASQQIEVGNEVSLATVADRNDNWYFNGWNYADNFTMPNYDVTVIGSWSLVDGYVSPKVTLSLDTTSQDCATGPTYTLTDTICYNATVFNNTGKDLTSVIIEESLANAQFNDSGSNLSKVSDNLVKIRSMSNGASVTIPLTYTVTPDSQFGDVQNIVSVKDAMGATDNSIFKATAATTSDPVQVRIEKIKFNLSAEAEDVTGTTATHTEGDSYHLRDVIKFEYRITNSHEYDVTDVVVGMDGVNGAEFVQNSNYDIDENNKMRATIPVIQHGQTITVEAQYTVSEASIYDDNTLSFYLESGDGPKGYELDSSESAMASYAKDVNFNIAEILWAPNDFHITPLNPKANGEPYHAGENIEYEISFTNPLSYDISNLTIETESPNSNVVFRTKSPNYLGYVQSGQGVSINKPIKPGAVARFYAYIPVTNAADFDNINNVFTAWLSWAETAQTGYAFDYDQEVSDSVEFELDEIKVAPELEVTLDKASRSYMPEEDVNFTLKVTNNSDVVMSNVIIKLQQDDNSGAMFVTGNGYKVNYEDEVQIVSLRKGESRAVNISANDHITGLMIGSHWVRFYVDDFSVTNGYYFDYNNKPSVTAEYDAIERPVIPEITPSVVIKNGKNKFHIGETIDFDVVVKNTSNVPIRNVEVKKFNERVKFLADANYSFEENGDTATIGTINSKSEKTIHVQYTIVGDETLGENGVDFEIVRIDVEEGYGLDPNTDFRKTAVYSYYEETTLSVEEHMIGVLDEENNVTKVTNFQVSDVIVLKTTISSAAAEDGGVAFTGVEIHQNNEHAKFVTKEGQNYTISADGLGNVANITNLAPGESVDVYTEIEVVSGMHMGPSNENKVWVEKATPPAYYTANLTDAKSEITFTTVVTNVQPKLEATITEGDDHEFKVGDEVHVTLTIKNESLTKMEGIVFDNKLDGSYFPEDGAGYQRQSDSDNNENKRIKIPALNAGASINIPVVYTITTDTEMGEQKMTFNFPHDTMEYEYTVLPGFFATYPDDYVKKIKTIITKVEPSFSAEIVNPQPSYGVGTEIKAKLTITNPYAEFDMDDVKIKQTHNTAEFKFEDDKSDYTIKKINKKTAGNTDNVAEVYVTYTAAKEHVSESDIENTFTIDEITVLNGYEYKPDTKLSQTISYKVVSNKITMGLSGGLSEGQTPPFFKDDEVEFEFTIRNNLVNDDLTNVTVEMNLANAYWKEDQEGLTIGENDSSKATIANIPKNNGNAEEGSVTYKAIYKVNTTDIATLTNTFKVTGMDSDKTYIMDPDYSFEYPVSFLVNKHAESSLNIVVDADDAETRVFEAGEVVNFNITIENNSEVTISNIILNENTTKLPGVKFVTEGMTGYTSNNADNTSVKIGAIATGETQVVKATYTVPQDKEFGKYENEVSIQSAEVPINYSYVKPVAASIEFNTKKAVLHPEMTAGVVGAVTGFHVADVIRFYATFKNTSVFPIENVLINENFDQAHFIADPNEDVANGVAAKYTVVEGNNRQAKIDYIAAGETITVYSEYTAREEELNDQTNYFQLAGFDLPQGTEYDFTQVLKAGADYSIANYETQPTISVTIPDQQAQYYLGDTINFDITVTNVAPAEIPNFEIETSYPGFLFNTGVSDEDKVIWEGNQNKATISKLQASGALLSDGETPADRVTISGSYTVNGDEDLFENEATFTIKKISANTGYVLDSNGNYSDSVIFVIKKHISPELWMEITDKNADDSTKTEFKVGETVHIKTSVVNPVPSKLTNVRIDEINTSTEGEKILFVDGANYTASGKSVMIDEIAESGSVNIYSTYTVSKDTDFSSDMTSTIKVLSVTVEDTDRYTAVAENTKSIDFTPVYTDVTPMLDISITPSKSEFLTGETVEFITTVKNISNENGNVGTYVKNIYLEEGLNGAEFYKAEGETTYDVDPITRRATIAQLNPGDTVYIKSRFAVPVNSPFGTYTNSVSLDVTTPPTPVENGFVFVKPAPATTKFTTKMVAIEPKVTVNITNTPANGSVFKTGEVIEFLVSVENTQDPNADNIAYEDVVLKTSQALARMAGAPYATFVEDAANDFTITPNTDNQEATISSIPAGETKSIKAQLVVTEGLETNEDHKAHVAFDIESMSLPNGYSYTAASQEGGDIEFTAEQTEVNLAVSTTVTTNQEKYVPGDTLGLKVNIENNGSDDLTGVEITLPYNPSIITIVDKPGVYTYDETTGTVTIASLPAGESVDIEFTITVPDNAEDLESKPITISGVTLPNGYEIEGVLIDAPEIEIDANIVSKSDPTKVSVETTATVTDPAGTNYHVGDKVHTEIEFKNTGDETLNDFVIERSNEDVEFKSCKIIKADGSERDGCEVIENGTKVSVDRLEPGESVKIETEIEVPADPSQFNQNPIKINGNIDLDDDSTFNPQDLDLDLNINVNTVDPVDQSKVALTITPTISNPQTYYAPGYTANVTFALKNTGQAPLKKVIIAPAEENLNFKPGSNYSVVDGKVEMENVAVGQTVNINARIIVPQPSDYNNHPITIEKVILNDDTEFAGKDDIETTLLNLDIRVPSDPGEVSVTAKGTVKNEKDVYQPGDKIEYEVEFKNTGTEDLDNVVIAPTSSDVVFKSCKIVDTNGETVSGANCTINPTTGKAEAEKLEPGQAMIIDSEITVPNDPKTLNKNPFRVEGITLNDGTEFTAVDQIEISPNIDVQLPSDPSKASATVSSKILNRKESYATGDDVEIEFSVFNDGQETLKNIVIEPTDNTVTILPGEGYRVVDGKAVIDELEARDVVKINTKVTVPENPSDLNRNPISISGIKLSDGTSLDNLGEKVNLNVNINVAVEEPVTPSNPDDVDFGVMLKNIIDKKNPYNPGDTIKTEIQFLNLGDEALTDIVLKTNGSGVIFAENEGYTLNDDKVNIESLPVGGRVSVLTYIIAPDSAANLNTHPIAVESMKMSDGVAFTGLADFDLSIAFIGKNAINIEIPVEPSNPANVAVSASAAVQNEAEVYYPGDKVTAKITFTSTGDEPLKNIVIAPTSDDVNFKRGTGYTVTDGYVYVTGTMNKNDSIEINTEITVPADITTFNSNPISVESLKMNDGTAYENASDLNVNTNISVNIEERPVTPPTPTVDPSKVNVSTSYTLIDEAEKYEPGDTVKVAYTFKNTGDETLKRVVLAPTSSDVTVEGNDGYYVNQANNKTTITNLAEDGSVTMEVHITVPENISTFNKNPLALDMIILSDDSELENLAKFDEAMKVNVSANIVEKQPTPSNPDDVDVDISSEIVDPKPSYRPGDKVKTDITFENTGEETLKDVVIKPTSNEVEFKSCKVIGTDGHIKENACEIKNGNVVVGELAKGEKVIVNTEIEVPENLDNFNRNPIQIEGIKMSDGENYPSTGDIDVNVDLEDIKVKPTNPDVDIKTEGEVTSDPNKIYQPGDKVEMDLKFENTGTEELDNLVIKPTSDDVELKSCYILDADGQRKEGGCRIDENGNVVVDKLLPGEKVIVKTEIEVPENPKEINRNPVEIEGVKLDDGTDYENKDDLDIDINVPVKVPSNPEDIDIDVTGEITGENTKFKPGDKIPYDINFKNNSSDETLNDFVIEPNGNDVEFKSCEILDKNGAVKEGANCTVGNDGKIHVDKLEPGESVKIHTEITVPQNIEDLNTNPIKVKDITLDDGESFENDNKIDIDIDLDNEIEIEPTVTPSNPDDVDIKIDSEVVDPKPSYRPGDKVKTDITFENTGEETLKDIVIKPTSDDVEFKSCKVIGADGEEKQNACRIENGNVIVDKLEKDEKVIINTEIEVPENLSDFNRNPIQIEGVKMNDGVDYPNKGDIDIDVDLEDIKVKPTDPNVDIKTEGEITSDPDKIYRPGDKVEMDLKFENTGDEELDNLVIKPTSEDVDLKSCYVLDTEGHRKEGGCHIDENGNAVVDKLLPGEKVIVQTEIEVPENPKDINRNPVEIEGVKLDDGTDYDKKDDLDIDINVPVQVPSNPEDINIDVTGEITGDNTKFKPGDKIPYDINFKNNSNDETLNDFVIEPNGDDVTFKSCEILDKNGNVKQGANCTVGNDGNIHVDKLEPGESVKIHTEITVPQNIEDLNTTPIKVKDITLDDGESFDDNSKIDIDINIEDDIDFQKPSNPDDVDVDISSEIVDPKPSYRPGEKVKTDITFENTGEETLKDVVIKPTSNEVEFKSCKVIGTDGHIKENACEIKNGNVVVGELAKGEKVIVNTEIEVPENLDNFNRNPIQIEGIKMSDGENYPSTGDIDVNVDLEDIKVKPTNPDVDIKTEGEVTSDPNKIYQPGDKVEMDLKFENTGTEELDNLVIKPTSEDVELKSCYILDADGQHKEGGCHIDENGNAVVDKLLPGEKVIVKTEIEVPENPKEINRNPVEIEGVKLDDGTDYENKDDLDIDINVPVKVPSNPDDVKLDVSSEVEKEPGKDGYKPGEKVKVNIDFENKGEEPLENIIIKPTGEDVVIKSCQITGKPVNTGCTILPDGTVKVDELKPGEKVTIKTEVEVPENPKDLNKQPVTIENIKLEDGTDYNDEGKNNINIDIDVPVKVVPDVNIDVTPEIKNPQDTYKPGDELEMTLDFANNGDEDLKNVIIKPTHDGVTFLPGDGYDLLPDGTVLIRDLPKGESVKLNIKMEVPSNPEELKKSPIKIEGITLGEDKVFDDLGNIDLGITTDINIEIERPDDPNNPGGNDKPGENKPGDNQGNRPGNNGENGEGEKKDENGLPNTGENSVFPLAATLVGSAMVIGAVIFVNKQLRK